MNTSFERTLFGKDEWLTPPSLIKSLGEFDLDPCSPINRPWDTAKIHYTINDMGLLKDWKGRVWLNPPYGSETGNWLGKLQMHGNGIALVFARTDTSYFQEYVFGHADSILFISGRLTFYNVNGRPANSNAGAPSALIAYGENNSSALATCGIKGKHLTVNNIPVIVVGISPDWKSVVSIALTRLNGTGPLQQIYELVELIAPDKLAKNKHHKEKIRQTLQIHFSRVNKGVYSKAIYSDS